MIPVYAHEPLPKKMTRAIFLAGPTPRSPAVPSWRKDALKALEAFGYDGHVFIPEPADGVWTKDYEGQIEWEEAALNQADCILFWVPRDLDTMPAFTTNDEWGFWKHSGKVVFGAPEDAAKVRYQEHYAAKYKVPTAKTLFDTVKLAIAMVKNGRLRQGGEVKVPLFVWDQASFQSWYSYQLNAGNVLKDARVLWTFRVGSRLDKMFCWVLQVSVYITSEDRTKDNEFVFGRPDIGSIVLWHRGATLGETQVVLIKEFRSPGKTFDGFLREPPGGSQKLGSTITDFQHVALDELKEEAGFKLDPARLNSHGYRQLYGTLSSVCAYVYSAEITDAELAFFKSQAGVMHGVKEETEQTYVEIHRVGDLLKHQVTDWSSLGMIFSALSAAMR